MDRLEVPCGHGVWIVATEAGTNYCGWCALIAEVESLRQQLAQAREGLKQAIDDLAASGYCYDHPQLIKFRKMLTGKE